MNDNDQPFEDEIDLHEIILTLWHKRWIIMAVTISVALIVFVISFWFLPKKYQATAYISVKMPIMDFKTIEGININQNLPDSKSLADLAKAPGLLNTVRIDKTIATSWDATEQEPLTITNLAGMLQVNVVSQDLFGLQVTDTDPSRAALIANIWAEQMVTTINSTYGISAIIESLGKQVALTQQEYEQAQAALEDELARNNLSIFNAQLTNETFDLGCLLSETSATTRVLNDLQVLKERLQALPAETSLSLGDTLALTTLQQRALSSQVCATDTQSLQVQVSSADLNDLTPLKALESISQIQDPLKSWQLAAADRQTQLEQHIPLLQNNMEMAKNQLDKFMIVRDQTQTLWGALLQQQNRIVASRTQGNQIATLSIQAVAPEKKSSPSTMLNTALAGVAGLILVMFWVFLQSWWKDNLESEQKIKQDHIKLEKTL